MEVEITGQYRWELPRLCTHMNDVHDGIDLFQVLLCLARMREMGGIESQGPTPLRMADHSFQEKAVAATIVANFPPLLCNDFPRMTSNNTEFELKGRLESVSGRI